MASSESRKRSADAADENAAIFNALSHPLRSRLFVVLSERVASPSEISEMLGDASTENIAYHCRKMEKAGVVELVGTGGGGKQRFYKASAIARPALDTEEWQQLPRIVQEAGSVSISQLVVGDLGAAIRAGTFDSHPARSLLRMPMLLDPKGIEETAEVTMTALDALAEVQARSAERLAETGEAGINMSSAILVYPAPDKAARF
ncbi:MAG: ArsR/SmtB family transcription factor [Solirubrobacterales bacterium]